jgi:chemotaxis signal transduction protein
MPLSIEQLELTVAVVRSQHRPLALAIRQVCGITRLAEQEIQSANAAPLGIRGWIEQEGSQPLWILEPDVIALMP